MRIEYITVTPEHWINSDSNTKCFTNSCPLEKALKDAGYGFPSVGLHTFHYVMAGSVS